MIAFDAAATGSVLPGTSITYSHTCTGTNRTLIVSAEANTGSDVVTGITYNGVAMTLVGKVSSGTMWSYLYILVNPASGANNVVVSISSSNYVRALSASYTGTLQTGQPDSFATNYTAGATSLVTSTTVVKNNSWVVGMIANDGALAMTDSTGVVATRASLDNTTKLSDSNGPVSPGAYGMTWTFSSQAAASVLVSIRSDSDVSTSSSVSASPSLSPSLSPSASQSRSPSASVSPSSSQSRSPSRSVSASPSPTPSASPSRSPSASVSPSASESLSFSRSPSVSVSASPSPTPSASPSAGYSLFSRGGYSILPTDDTDLETFYTDEEEIKVSTSNDIRVSQLGALEYLVHQFKVFVGANTKCEITCEFQTSLSPTLSPVYLQLYNRTTSLWETVASDMVSAQDIDIELTAATRQLTKYKDASNVIACRIYQLSL